MPVRQVCGVRRWGSIGLLFTVTLGLRAEAGSLQDRAQRLFPQTAVDSVDATPVPGLYEIRSGHSILYMDESGRYVVIGELYDFQARKNLTAERLLNVRAIRFDDLPLEQAIRLGPESGRRRLAVFVDVECPFCRRLHEEVLPALTQEGVPVYIFLFPLERLHPQAKAKSEAIWCSSNRPGALEAVVRNLPLRDTDHDASQRLGAGQNAVRRGNAVQGTSGHGEVAHDQAQGCTAPLPAIQALATRLGITATPTLILDTGELVEGYITKEALMAKWPPGAGR